VLVVEDDPDVREVVAEILSRAGYLVHALESLRAVEALLSAHPRRMRLLLTDLVLPGGSGLEVAALVRSHHPGLPVLFMSGYSEGVFSGGQRVEHLLQKPFSSAVLLAKVAELVEPVQASIAS
jgi:CheY-like chemotaxis protein